MINKKRIFNIEGYLTRYLTDNDFFIGVNAKDISDELLKRAGITRYPGKKGVPLKVGPISKYNAYGKVVKLKNQPKVKIAQQRYSRKTGEYLGTWHIDVWQKETLPPLNEYIETVQVGDEILFVSKPLVYEVENEGINCHLVNLFLEVFGRAAFYTRDFQRMHFEPSVQEAEWSYFPEGTSLSEKKEYVERIANEKQKLGITNYKSYMEVLNIYAPSNIIKGKNSFGGYYAFLFPEREIVIVENPDYGNATYVLPYKNWEETSKLTKGEVVEGKHCLMRVQHDENWPSRIQGLMSQ